MKRLIAAVACLALMLGCGTAKEDAMKAEQKIADIQKELDKFAPVELTFDASVLTDQQKDVVRKLVEAAKIMDKLFLVQSWQGNPELIQKLSASTDPVDAKTLELVKLYFGPFNRLAHNKPFVDGVGEKPAGAGYYPEDMTKAEFQAHLVANPDDAGAFESNFTVIERKDGKLVAVPYSQAYKADLDAAAALLREAADLSENESVADYLRKRADAFASNDYFESDIAWMDMKDHLIEVVIGPYEVYEDALFNYKAAFETFITVVDPAKSAELLKIADYLVDMEKNLPIPDEHKNFNRGLDSPTIVADEVFSAGDTKAGVQTLAFNLPNDERVREAKGSKKVMLRNVGHAKYDKCYTPIAAVAMNPDALQNTSFDAYFMHTYLHEISHGLGPGTIMKDGKQTTVNKELKETYSIIEEAKADICGVYNGLFLIDKGEFEKDYEAQVITTFVGGIFRSVRFGINEAHGGANAILFNRLMDEGLITFDAESGQFGVNLETGRAAVKAVAAQVLMIEAEGNYDAAKKLMDEYQVIRPEMQQVLDKLGDVPVDIKPIFPTI